MQLHLPGDRRVRGVEDADNAGIARWPGANGTLSLAELPSAVQFFNMGGYHFCPYGGSDDGYCPSPE